MKRFLAWSAVLAVLATGCETVRGAGRDIQNFGSGVQTAFSGRPAQGTTTTVTTDTTRTTATPTGTTTTTY